MSGRATVQVSTGSLAPLGGGRYWNVEAMLKGMRALAWPSVELRLWQEWDEGDMAVVAASVRDAGFLVGSVHLPPETEALLSVPGSEREAKVLMDSCLKAAREGGAKVAVVHAWDLRIPRFSQHTLHESLCRFGGEFGSSGVSLSVEAIPGHTDVLPELVRTCPGVSFTLDTQWACLENSWRLHPALMPRVTNYHVQTHVDLAADGGVVLGRTGTGPGFDAETVVRGLVTAGFEGLVTLEPRGVPKAGETQLRQALRKLEAWLQEIPEPPANMSGVTSRSEEASG